MKKYINTSKDYGGAYDIDSRALFSGEEIRELAYEVCDILGDYFRDGFDVVDVAYYPEQNRISITVENNFGYQYGADIKLDLRKFRDGFDLVGRYARTFAEDIIQQIEDDRIYSSTKGNKMKKYIKSNREDSYFGEVMCRKYGDLVRENLAGMKISKRISDADKPGGIEYEAEQLGMDLFDLIECLEGMCYNGEAKELRDGIYYVYEDEDVEAFLDLNLNDAFNNYGTVFGEGANSSIDIDEDEEDIEAIVSPPEYAKPYENPDIIH